MTHTHLSHPPSPAFSLLQVPRGQSGQHRQSRQLQLPRRPRPQGPPPPAAAVRLLDPWDRPHDRSTHPSHIPSPSPSPPFLLSPLSSFRPVPPPLPPPPLPMTRFHVGSQGSTGSPDNFSSHVARGPRARHPQQQRASWTPGIAHMTAAAAAAAAAAGGGAGAAGGAGAVGVGAGRAQPVPVWRPGLGGLPPNAVELGGSSWRSTSSFGSPQLMAFYFGATPPGSYRGGGLGREGRGGCLRMRWSWGAAVGGAPAALDRHSSWLSISEPLPLAPT
ncbi:unnamed protein product, partial [Closterium sp. NIES-53]